MTLFPRRKGIEFAHTEAGGTDVWSAGERNKCIRRKNTVPMGERREDV